ncbi:GNAT family N-acetyltransferase [Paenibacillus gansuensis]|uniref:GNAT family N-acetyltransferase n=1 Tax=Paenibacillus gansuensis TaxID=306542 RepID=A0ABW5PIJ6_9BACL
MPISTKRLSNFDQVKLLDSEFSKYYPWFSISDYHERCLSENEIGLRVTLLAYDNDELAGCSHLLYESNYPYFLDNKIPEINDLNVFPHHRNKRIASRLFDELEEIAAKTTQLIGLGVGLYKDYGNAQRMYCKRGYVLDGNGISYQNNEVKPGETVVVNDELLLYLVKELSNSKN